MKKQRLKNKGFSLLEIMVVVAIMGIMASSVVIGFNSFAETVQVKETAGVVTDIVKNLELELIRRDYKKQTLHFEEKYLVIEGEVEDQTLLLNWKGVGGSCDVNEGELEIDNSAGMDTIFLAQRDQYGNNTEVTPIAAGMTEDECIAFNDSDETQWQYQVFQGSEVSQIIRFLHFNLRRNDGPEQVSIQPNSYSLEVSAPYAAKELYNGTTLETGSATLTLENADASSLETITLQQ